MPPRVRELIDSHGTGIPHFAIEARYIVDVWPEPTFKRHWGAVRLGGWRKVVRVFDRESGESWAEAVE